MSRSLKFILYTLGMLVALVIVVELCARIAFAIQVGPSVLFFGTNLARHEATKPESKRSVTMHENNTGNYSKYFPNQVRYDTDQDGEMFQVKINGRGFRGKEYQDEKEAGVVRIVTLGASSTFGYFNRDNETYPNYLEQQLNSDNCGNGTSFEVINLGIPHLRSEEILNLFLSEGIQLKPDVVTFYEGINDSGASGKNSLRAKARSVPLLRRQLHWIRTHLVIAALIHKYIDSGKRRFPAEEVNARIEGRSDQFLGNLDHLNEASNNQDYLFIVANQQAKSGIIPRHKMQGVTYSEEVQLIKNDLENNGDISQGELHLIVHNELMKDVQDWASSNDVPFVDIISALDSDRRVLLSWVHLNPQGNRIIAREFAKEILGHVCHQANSVLSVRPSE